MYKKSNIVEGRHHLRNRCTPHIHTLSRAAFRRFFKPNKITIKYYFLKQIIQSIFKYFFVNFLTLLDFKKWTTYSLLSSTFGFLFILISYAWLPMIFKNARSPFSLDFPLMVKSCWIIIEGISHIFYKF